LHNYSNFEISFEVKTQIKEVTKMNEEQKVTGATSGGSGSVRAVAALSVPGLDAIGITSGLAKEENNYV